VYSQNKQDYVWLFGQHREFSGTDTAYRFDFNIKPFVISKAINKYGFGSQNASICDAEGNLLFFSNGCAILNKDAEVMPNGDSLNHDIWYDKYWLDCEIMGYPGSEDIIILQDPGNVSGYYVLHKKNVYNAGVKDSLRLQYSYVDMELDGGKGDVVFKNRILWYRDNLMYSYLTAIRHKNGKDWWVLQPIIQDSVYLTYLIDDQGIHQQAHQNSGQFFTRYRSSASGTARFSPDGTRYAFYNFGDQLHLYDFDRETGQLSNHQHVVIYDSINVEEDIRFSSVEWSPDGRFIYTATDKELHQIDTREENLIDGIRLIDTYNGTLDPFPTPLYLMALGPDCRIYMCSTNGSYSYHVIHKPNELGLNCDFVQNGIRLPYAFNRGCMPNFPRFRVDDDEKCDPTIVSVFGNLVWYRRNLNLFPNPSSGLITIQKPEDGSGRIIVTDMQGTLLETQLASREDDKTTLDLSHLPPGTYLVEYYPDLQKDRIFYSAKVVVAR